MTCPVSSRTKYITIPSFHQINLLLLLVSIRSLIEIDKDVQKIETKQGMQLGITKSCHMHLLHLIYTPFLETWKRTFDG